MWAFCLGVGGQERVRPTRVTLGRCRIPMAGWSEMARQCLPEAGFSFRASGAPGVNAVEIQGIGGPIRGGLQIGDATALDAPSREGEQIFAVPESPNVIDLSPFVHHAAMRNLR